MSLLFLGLTLLTFWLSHFWAEKNRPKKPASHSIIKKFSGTKDELIQRLQEALNENSNFKLLKWTRSEIVISEDASLLQFGCFYYLDLNTSKGEVHVRISIQPKLVGDPERVSPQLLTIFDQVELSDVG